MDILALSEAGAVEFELTDSVAFIAISLPSAMPLALLYHARHERDSCE